MSVTSSVISEEVAFFEKHAFQWWDPKGPLRTLHALNPPRMAFIEQVAHQAQMQAPGVRCLDIGCGGGLLAESLYRCDQLQYQGQSPEVHGIDASAMLIDVARMHAASQQLEIHYAHQTAEARLDEEQHGFDLICALEIIEHVADPTAFMATCSQLLKPGGHLVISTLSKSLQAFLLAIVAGEHLLKLLPKGSHHYEQLIRPSTLLQMAETQGLQFVDASGLFYNPWTHHARLTRRMDVNYLMAFRRPT